MSQKKSVWSEKVIEFSMELKLPSVRKYLDEHVKEAVQKDASYEEFLALLLQRESDTRHEAAQYNRIRRAEFPYKKHLEDLRVEELPPDAQKKYKILKTLDFIKEGKNIILAGSPGTGNYRKFLFMARNKCIFPI
ncbi:ATP-binding protein [Anaerobacillus isosaccharinicus]|uniref:ATP-binding protein n=1 Tax=Anaerobacillus isosaccharinicus TaxID=1532552 RepID=A0A7S7L5E9_9BACI|nr:ATP-binding protein [Anaerobacillus isosaccharinicus]MBA5587099.1 ATP-binding protein [Anaerobacillus isosaccharinicus]QOY34705.1 ATP-binding protein [Anaerobacillus isosaccharinicus]